MKNTLFLVAAALLFSASIRAQSTADSIEAKYKLLPMPQATTVEQTFPVLGSYQLNSTSAAGNIVITLDSSNKGIVWIEGLPEGTMKAYLKRSPATYRIVPQSTGSGKRIPEGTLIFNPESNTLNISLGAPFNEADPAAIFTATNSGTDVATVSTTHAVKVKTKTATSKTKERVMYYTATKNGQNSTTSVQ